MHGILGSLDVASRPSKRGKFLNSKRRRTTKGNYSTIFPKNSWELTDNSRKEYMPNYDRKCSKTRKIDFLSQDGMEKIVSSSRQFFKITT